MKIVYRKMEEGRRVSTGIIITIAVVVNIVLHASLKLETYLFERMIRRMREGKE
jgi:hypothetical protein